MYRSNATIVQSTIVALDLHYIKYILSIASVNQILSTVWNGENDEYCYYIGANTVQLLLSLLKAFTRARNRHTHTKHIFTEKISKLTQTPICTVIHLLEYSVLTVIHKTNALTHRPQTTNSKHSKHITRAHTHRTNREVG